MIEHTAEQVREKVDAVYRSESRRIFATLIRLLGDFELAEDALHDAFSAALEQWPKEAYPPVPGRGLFLRGGSRPSTRCDGALGSIDSQAVYRGAIRSRGPRRREPLTTRASRMTGFG